MTILLQLPTTQTTLPIEDYLLGVVSSEIGGATLSAAKAQAVAARTFAMSRMASRGFLYGDTRDQVYSATKRDAISTQAVQETAGEVLFYNGAPALALYGASNGGRTRQYSNYPYLIEREDTWDAFETARRRELGRTIRVGNRYGLSQYGAMWASREGVDYRAILNFYYPNTQLLLNYGKGGEGMVPVKQFLEKVIEIEKLKPKYKLGQSGQNGYCDCIGLIIGAIRRAGGTWGKTHGSNYAARNEMVSMRKVTGANMAVESGELVYRFKAPHEAGWKLPDTYKNHPDQNDYNHVGVIVSTNPMTIYDCTSVPSQKIDGIRIAHNLAAWHRVGKTKRVDYSAGGGVVNPDFTGEKKLARLVVTSGSTVNLRKGPGTDTAPIRAVPITEPIYVYRDNGTWAAVEDSRQNQGYMMSQFIKIEEVEKKVVVELTPEVAEKLYVALQSALGK